MSDAVQRHVGRNMTRPPSAALTRIKYGSAHAVANRRQGTRAGITQAEFQ
jgi:hypothetical protein